MPQDSKKNAGNLIYIEVKVMEAAQIGMCIEKRTDWRSGRPVMEAEGLSGEVLDERKDETFD